MTIDQLKYLLTLNHCHSITQAARELHISHQALSASIKSLEKELGTALLIKTARGTTLTHQGKQLVEASADFFQALDTIFGSAALPPETFSVRIAASYVGITNYLADKLAHCTSLHLKPIFLEYAESLDIINAVETQMADIGLCAIFRPPSPTPPLDFSQLLPDSLCHHTISELHILCEMSPAHPLAYLEQIPLNKLRKYPLRYFYPRLYSQDADNQTNALARSSAFQFTNFFRQFDFAIESNPTFYTQALQNGNCIGITIAQTPDTPYKLPRIPLQADCAFELIAIRPRKACYNSAEDFLFYG